jgi:hypothetical protein
MRQRIVPQHGDVHHPLFGHVDDTLGRISRVAVALAGSAKSLPASINEAHAWSNASQMARICCGLKTPDLELRCVIGTTRTGVKRRISRRLMVAATRAVVRDETATPDGNRWGERIDTGTPSDSAAVKL